MYIFTEHFKAEPRKFLEISFNDVVQLKIQVGEKKVNAKKNETFREILDKAGEENAIAVKSGGELKSLEEKVSHSMKIKPVPLESEEGKKILNHSTAHILAHAVKNLFPNAKPTIGPVTKDLPGPREIGFYYDFYREKTFTPQDLEKIEKRMKELINEGLTFRKREVSKEQAIKRYEGKNRFKVELIKEMERKVNLYKQSTNHDSFVDLCEGPHLSNSKSIKAFRLLGTSSAYWKGNEENPTVQRIYGIAFPSEKELEEYLERKEEAERRDHLKLGKKLDLFRIYGDIAPGFPIYTPKGKIILQELKSWMREINEQLGYKEVETPHLYKSKLWKRSGHYEAYKDKMFIIEGEKEKRGRDYAVKPMNCPGQIYLYKRKPRSYRDLPIRYSEFGTVYRWEKSGELHGLVRVRSPTQDDGHAFCRRDQIKGEVKRLLKVAKSIFDKLGIEDIEITLSTRPEKYIGEKEVWEDATNALKQALEEVNTEYKVAEEEGAFYGPKIDIHIKDALGRLWQCSTIQLDFIMPQRFDLDYVTEGGDEKRPIMIHRAIFGALDRFLGILIEHYNGKFPLWLSPVQTKVIPIADRNNDYAREITTKLKEVGIRTEGDFRDKSLSYKIRDGQVKRVPYMLIVGDREEEKHTISVRKRTEEEKHGVKLKEFIKKTKELIETKSLSL